MQRRRAGGSEWRRRRSGGGTARCGPQACRSAAVPCQRLPRHCKATRAAGQGPPAWSQLAAEGRCAGGACRPSAHAPNEFADCPRRGGARQAALRAPLCLRLCLQGALGAAPALAPVGAPGLRLPPSARGRAGSCLSMSPLRPSWAARGEHWPLANDRQRGGGRASAVGARQARPPAPDEVQHGRGRARAPVGPPA